MNFQFHVPAFPDFQGRLDLADYRRYDAYMTQFRNYAANVLSIQAKFAEKAVDKGYLREEIAELKLAIGDITNASAGCVEKASVLVEHEVSIAKTTIADEVEKLKSVVGSMTSLGSGNGDEGPVNVASAGVPVVGANWSRNVRNREARKARKLNRQSAGVDWRKHNAAGLCGSKTARAVDPSSGQAQQLVDDKKMAEAAQSLQEKWTAQNRLEAAKARRQLEVLSATDVDDEIRRRRTQVKRHTEQNMVAIEKTHKTLSATGNVPGEPAGGKVFAETVVGGSISPDSSASMQEFRAVQKQNLDLQQEVKKLRAAYRKAGGNPDAIDMYDKSVFTMEDGTIAQRYVKKFNELGLQWGIPKNPIEVRGGKKKTRIDFFGVKEEGAFDFHAEDS